MFTHSLHVPYDNAWRFITSGVLVVVEIKPLHGLLFIYICMVCDFYITKLNLRLMQHNG